MFSVNRIHFDFSNWTIVLNRLSHLVFLISYLSLISIGVSGQGAIRPNLQSSVSTLSSFPSSSTSLSPSSSSLPSSSTSIHQTKCPYSSEEILGVIFTSVVVTIVVIGLTLILFWFLWKKKLITLTGKLIFSHHLKQKKNYSML